MALVQLEGVLMGSHIKSSKFEGVEKHKLQLDLYQPDSNSNNKMVVVSSDDLSLQNVINKDYAQGSVIKVAVQVNAYKNQAYFKLDKIIS